MIYLLTGIVRILFAFVEGIVKLVLYLLRVFGLIVPALYLLVMFGINLATDNAVLESYYPLFVSGLCLSFVGAILLFFRNTVKNPLKAVRVNRRARELDRYEQELIAREQRARELEDRCAYLEHRLAELQNGQAPGYAPQSAPAAPAAQQVNSAYNPNIQPAQQQLYVASAPAQGSAYSAPAPYAQPTQGTQQTPAQNAFSAYSLQTAPYAGQTVSPAQGLNRQEGGYHESPQPVNPQSVQQVYPPQNGGQALGMSPQVSFAQTRELGQRVPETPNAERRGFFGRRDRGRADAGRAGYAAETRLQNPGVQAPVQNPLPPLAGVNSVVRPGTEPDIFRVRQDPSYLIYDYPDRRELYRETERGLKYIKTDYKE